MEEIDVRRSVILHSMPLAQAILSIGHELLYYPHTIGQMAHSIPGALQADAECTSLMEMVVQQCTHLCNYIRILLLGTVEGIGILSARITVQTPDTNIMPEAYQPGFSWAWEQSLESVIDNLLQECRTNGSSIRDRLQRFTLYCQSALPDDWQPIVHSIVQLNERFLVQVDTDLTDILLHRIKHEIRT